MPFRRLEIRSAARIAAASVLALSAAGCMTYRGPSGVEATIERKAAIELKREMGIKLGPLGTKIAASIMHQSDNDADFRDLSGFGVAVF